MRRSLTSKAASFVAQAAVLVAACPAQASAADADAEPLAISICRLIDHAAHDKGLPVAFLTRLIWRESAFQTRVVSPVGAMGVAQFMPGTARERGLADPFDPEEAIPKAAELLVALNARFGNLGLAAAAYNAGAARVDGWLAGGFMPQETRAYVLRITGRDVEDWRGGAAAREAAQFPGATCAIETAALRVRPSIGIARVIFAPWGVQLAAGFSKPAALAAFARNRARYSAVLGVVEPMVIGGRAARGFSAFYRVRVPAQTRAAADALCGKLTDLGGACVVLKS